MTQVGKQTHRGTSGAGVQAPEDGRAGVGLQASFLSAVFRITHAPCEFYVLPRPSDAAMGLPFGASGRVLSDLGCAPLTFPQSTRSLATEAYDVGK